MEYKLTEQELGVVSDLRSQYEQTQTGIENAKAQLNALQGAVNGIAVLIATQQGMRPTGKETVQFNTDFTGLVVVESV